MKLLGEGFGDVPPRRSLRDFLVSSRGRCNTSINSFCWRFKLRRPTRPSVELRCDLVQMLRA